MDWIIVNDLSLRIPIGASHWPKPGSEKSVQPVLVTVKIPFSVAQSAASDQLGDSVNYSSLAKAIESLPPNSTSLETFANAACSRCLDQFRRLDSVTIIVTKQKALLHADSIAYELTMPRIGNESSSSYHVRNLRLPTIIGIHPWERLEKQLVLINFTLEAISPVESSFELDYRAIIEKLTAYILASSFETVESIVSGAARTVLTSQAVKSPANGFPHFKSLTIRLAKPSALNFAESAEIQVTRTPEDFQEGSIIRASALAPSDAHWAVLALGSNLGNRVANIEAALVALENKGIIIKRTSFMYESAAMYYEDQPSFANATCLIETKLNPHRLLDALKEVETVVGRLETFRNGPRVVDLDILFYDDIVLNEPVSASVKRDLTIPHPRILEREFVLRPLADIIPDYTHPRTSKTIAFHLSSLVNSIPGLVAMRRIIVFPDISIDARGTFKTIREHVLVQGSQTYIMATLNATPDSFSDGGLNSSIPNALAYAKDAVANGASIIDIGGYSTRPGAIDVTPNEEIARVVPLIREIRSAGISLPISIDTFRPAVAKAALDVGANAINDVRALREEGMRELAAERGVPVIMMHSRGTDAAAQKDYAEGVMNGVKKELGTEIKLALDTGIRTWNIIADPGIGFSKSVEDNLELIRDLSQFTRPTSRSSLATSAGLHEHAGRAMDSDPLVSLPVLVGTSRKVYLGKLIERPDAQPAERKYATVAACVAAIQQGTDILRVHDVRSGKDGALVADAIFRGASH